jgi:hypothetical protein
VSPAGEQQVEACRRPAADAGVRHQVARPGSGATHRRRTLEVAVRRHAHHDERTTGQVAAHDADPERTARRGEPLGDADRPVDRQVARHHERDHQGSRPGAHRGDVGEVLDGSPPADVHPRRPVPTEVLVLHQHVGGDHHPAVRGVHHGGVVAGGDQRQPAPWEHRDDATEQRLLGEVTDEQVSHGGPR